MRQKTSIKQARKECFNFLGYTFGSHCYTKDGSWYTGASPSKKSVARIKQRVGDLLTPNNVGTWPEVRDRLNQMLKGWAAYFSYGTRRQAYQAVDYHVYDCVRHFLRRRHKVPSRGTTRFPYRAVFGELGVSRLRRSCLGAWSLFLPVASARYLPAGSEAVGFPEFCRRQF